MAIVTCMGARAEDCFNDELPLRNDLEPPPPGSAASLLQITDEDVQRVLEALAAEEQRRKAAGSHAAGDSERQ